MEIHLVPDQPRPAVHRAVWVRILGLSEIVVVVDCLVACSLQIWGVMEAIGEI
jgi:hypothetical protein